MYKFKKLSIVLASFLSGITCLNAQKASAPVKKDFIFSAVKGTVSKPDSIMLPLTAKSVKLVEGDTSLFKILSYKKEKLLLAFTPSSDFIGIARAKLQVRNSLSKLFMEINLTGFQDR